MPNMVSCRKNSTCTNRKRHDTEINYARYILEINLTCLDTACIQIFLLPSMKRLLLFTLVIALVLSAVYAQSVLELGTSACREPSTWINQTKIFSAAGITKAAFTYSGFELHPKFFISETATDISVNLTFTTNNTGLGFSLNGSLTNGGVDIIMTVLQSSSSASAARLTSPWLITGLSAIVGVISVEKKLPLLTLMGAGMIALPWSQAQTGL